ncbi:MAG: hypothetical protein QM742_18450 [Aquabacterium sp.]
MRRQVRAEVTRLSVRAGADPLVKLALMKAVYLHCMAAGVRWLVIGARSEALARGYRHLGFDALLPAWRDGAVGACRRHAPPHPGA